MSVECQDCGEVFESEHGLKVHHGHVHMGISANVVAGKSESERITVRVPTPLLDDFEATVEMGHYPNRSEAFRDALRLFIRERGESA